MGLSIGLVLVLASCATPLREAASTERPPSTAAEHRRSIVIRWATASEFENFGYHVYRGLSADGPFERQTETIIQGAGTTSLPQRYRFEDLAVEPGVDYYYFVESVDLSGTHKRFTPVRRFTLEEPLGSQP